MNITKLLVGLGLLLACVACQNTGQQAQTTRAFSGGSVAGLGSQDTGYGESASVDYRKTLEDPGPF